MEILKKAYRYDDEIVFYFDIFDNKYVARGGSLASKLNNPGLLLSHSVHCTEYRAIGSHHQYAIFRDPLVGQAALRNWIILTKYFDSPLIEIAKYYQPAYPEEYLNRLCGITKLAPQTKPRSLRSEEFARLLLGIQELADFSLDNRHAFALLPKITTRFHSSHRKVEFYLSGYENLLTKLQAIQRVENHQLDAVIVHRSNGETYLRSRPGHHCDQIRFQQQEYGIEKEFADAVREVGTEREGQCIWGFINGIFNEPERSLASANLISELANGEHVFYLANDAPGSFADVWMQLAGYRFGNR